MSTARKTVGRGRPVGSRSADPEIGAAFGHALAKLRLDAGVAQEALALAVGISRANLSSIETGKTVPTFGAVVKIAAGLGISVERLGREFDKSYKARAK